MRRPAIRTKHRLVAELEAELLRRVRMHRALSRADLARELKLAPSTVAIYVERLKREGFLLEGERVDRQVGRWPTLLSPNPEAGRFVGVDFEAHSLMTTVVDFSLGIVSRSRRAVASGEPPARILDQIKAAVQAAVPPDSSPLLGVGVGLPGVVDSARGAVSYYKFVPEWTNMPVADPLAQQFGVPVHVESNIRSMAMAEMWLGKGRGLRNFVCLGVRTGIGIGIVINGELFRGQGGAGEIGAWSVSDGPPRDGLAPVENLESAASLGAILAGAAKAMGRPIDFPTFKNAIRDGDHRVEEVLKRAAAVHAAALRRVHLLLEPERIVVVGPLSELGAPFVTQLVVHIGSRFDGAAPVIVHSDFGQFGGALGAATLAAHRWEPKR